MKSRIKHKVLLIDENKIIGLAIKAFLEKSSMQVNRIDIPFSSNNNEKEKYDYIILNLSYYNNYNETKKIIDHINHFQFKTLIIISNKCFSKHCLSISKKYNVIVLCNKNLFNTKLPHFSIDDIIEKRIDDCDEWNKKLFDKETNHDFTTLSLREKEIITLISKGHTSNTIANILFITKKTVDFHRRNLKRKLNCKTFAELIILATQMTLVDYSNLY